jgi:predicted dehydrogenase
MVISASSSSLGRRVRLAVVGGGGNALIGPVHRIAARLDDRFEICAGVLSSDPARSIADATALHIPRGYADMATMIAEEARRPDPIDAVAIMTPNDSHHRYAAMALDAGLDVICDKPITNDFDEALDLVERARSRRLVFCLTHNYSGYPMVREARATIEAGEIGPLRVLHVSYVQGSLGTRVEDQPDAMSSRLKWRLDPAKGGLSHVLGDIGTHAHQLLTYTSGQRVESVLADVGAALPGRTTHDTASIIFRLEGGARGVMFVTKAATGAENALSLEAYGEAGGVTWQQASVNELRVVRNNRPVELRTRGLPTLYPLTKRATRLPPGHPEAFLEAFANVYADFADLVAARRSGQPPDPLAAVTPNAVTGAEGIAFIDACIESTRTQTWAAVRRVP